MDVPDADLSVELWELLPDGSAAFLNQDDHEGALSRFAARGKAGDAGEAGEVCLRPFPVFSRQIAKGSRLRLIVASLNTPSTEKNYNSGGVVAKETGKDAKTAHIQLLHDAQHPKHAGASSREVKEALCHRTSREIRSGKFRAGFVAIIGRPNAGKLDAAESLCRAEGLAIVTSKPQTTRNRIQGIVTRPQGQIVFIDTPGLHEAHTVLNRQMMREVAAALEGIDVLLMMVDASATQPHADQLLLDKAKRFQGKAILALNKTDRVPKPKLLPLLEAFSRAFPFAAVGAHFRPEGKRLRGTARGNFQQLLAEGEPYFPEDQMTDQPERFSSPPKSFARRPSS